MKLLRLDEFVLEAKYIDVGNETLQQIKYAVNDFVGFKKPKEHFTNGVEWKEKEKSVKVSLSLKRFVDFEYKDSDNETRSDYVTQVYADVKPKDGKSLPKLADIERVIGNYSAYRKLKRVSSKEYYTANAWLGGTITFVIDIDKLPIEPLE